MLRDDPSDGVWWPEQRAQEKGQLSWSPAARKHFAEEAFELRLVVLAGVRSRWVRWGRVKVYTGVGKHDVFEH